MRWEGVENKAIIYNKNPVGKSQELLVLSVRVGTELNRRLRKRIE